MINKLIKLAKKYYEQGYSVIAQKFWDKTKDDWKARYKFLQNNKRSKSNTSTTLQIGNRIHKSKRKKSRGRKLNKIHLNKIHLNKNVTKLLEEVNDQAESDKKVIDDIAKEGTFLHSSQTALSGMKKVVIRNKIKQPNPKKLLIKNKRILKLKKEKKKKVLKIGSKDKPLTKESMKQTKTFQRDHTEVDIILQLPWTNVNPQEITNTQLEGNIDLNWNGVMTKDPEVVNSNINIKGT